MTLYNYIETKHINNIIGIYFDYNMQLFNRSLFECRKLIVYNL